jgi:nitroimidazol reductase NimA-like FMN-containing flavoprotein (pyridoxamine 5'-phosphate oxidase superfamily)
VGDVARLVDLDADECLRLLRTQVVGRLAVQTDTGVDVVPVNYAVVQDAVHIRVAHGGRLARCAAERRVAFEVDVVDPERWAGWSVVVKGLAEVLGPGDALLWEQLLPRAQSWAGEDERSLLRLPCDSITGRRVGGLP